MFREVRMASLCGSNLLPPLINGCSQAKVNRLRNPPHRAPIEDPSVQRPECDDKGQALILRETEGNVEWHPIPNQIKAVDQIGVPAQFPAV